ncbi:MAG: glycosyltransferase family 4 protein [Hyphomicrobiales bacterium]
MPAAIEGGAESDPELRVALFTGNYDYIKDGVALTLNRLVAYLQSQAVPVLVFAPTARLPAFESVGEVVSVPSIPIPSRSEYRISLGLPRKARARLAEFRPSLFHIAVPDILGYRALALGRRWNVPVVASYHTRYDTYLRYYGLGILETLGTRYLRWFYSRCRQVYPPSESMAAILREEGVTAEMRIWSRGIDSGLFDPRRRSPEWRRALGLSDEDVVVTYVGRLVKEKNTGLLARLFAELARGEPRLRGMIVGDGPEASAMKSALPGAVFTGFLHGEDLARAYASADVFVFPSESETFGNVTLEAMASGLPAVCADASGSRSLVEEGETGFLARGNSEGEFIALIRRLVQDDALRQRMGAAARKRALDFSWEKSLRGLHQNYLEVLRAPV